MLFKVYRHLLYVIECSLVLTMVNVTVGNHKMFNILFTKISLLHYDTVFDNVRNSNAIFFCVHLLKNSFFALYK